MYYSSSFFYLFRSLDNLERIIDDKMKLLSDFARHITVTHNYSHQSKSSSTPNDTMEGKNDVVFD